MRISNDPLIEVHDASLPDHLQKAMQDYLVNVAWQFGSLSSAGSKAYPYWYRHFGGFNPGNVDDCAAEVAADAPVIASVWDHLKSSPEVAGHKLIRCYANGYPYGCEGVGHRDSDDPTDRTILVYANSMWDYSWAGETVFLTMQPPADVITAILPRPNRMVIFQADVPHVARAISRLCPVLRITLMFKTKRIA